MGNVLSFGQKSKAKQDASLIAQEEQRRLQERYGVLVPPTFIAGAGMEGHVEGGTGIGTHSHLQRLAASASPNVVDQLWNSNTGRTLLDEYMRPGLFFNVPVNLLSRSGAGGGGGPGGQILVALDTAAGTWRHSGGVDTAVGGNSLNGTQATMLPAPSRVDPPIPDHAGSTSASASASAPLVPPPAPPALSMGPSSSPVPAPAAAVSSPLMSPLSSMSFLSMTQSFSPLWDVQLMVPMGVPSSSISSSPSSHDEHLMGPALQVTSRAGGLLPYTTLSARINQNSSARPMSANNKRSSSKDSGSGWINATVRLPFIKEVTGIECVFGSWMSMESIGNLFHDYSATSGAGVIHSSSSSARRYAPATIHLQAAAEYQESLMATHVELPILTPNTGGPFVPEVTDTMLWLNLNGGITDSSSSSSSDSPNASTPSSASSPASSESPPLDYYPPLWLALKQSYVRGNLSPTWTLNLSQILTFNRPVWNILEDRAPMVRNHLGWVVQLDRDPNANTSSWRASTSVQFNRNVGAKAVLDDNGRTLNYAVVLKRWAQPRATLSILNSIDLTNRGRHSLVGFGLELETTAPARAGGTASSGRRQSSDHAGRRSPMEHAEYQETVNIEGNRAPPTKIQISNYPSP
jgi:hypothetical protein